MALELNWKKNICKYWIHEEHCPTIAYDDVDLFLVGLMNISGMQKYFNKINRKHIDFVLAKPDNLQIMLLIELDDCSHDIKQAERDKFIDEGYDINFGARPLKRLVGKTLEVDLSRLLIEGKIKEHEEVLLDYQDDNYIIKKKN